jgi:ethanolamine utilization microcompartment shell protein EutS
MLTTRFIRAPRPGTLAMLLRRVSSEIREELEGQRFDAVGLVQTDLPSMFYLADVGQKAADVLAVEITGHCPQHISTIAFFGDTAAVAAALSAVVQGAEKN